VPHPTIRSLFIQQEMGETRGIWMAVVQEFDIDIKPTKLVKGQGLCKLEVEAQDQVNEDPGWENEMELWCGEASYISPGQQYWYEKLTYLLHHETCLDNLNPRERIALRFKSVQYRLITSVLFRFNYDGVLLIFLKREDADKALKQLHDGPAGGHFARDTTTHKILNVVYYCPSLFKDAHTYSRNCKTCQISTGREKREVIPLQSMTVSRSFEKLGLDIIGEITPRYSKQHKYILTSTNYFMKWVEAIPLTHVN
jgi:hypothetical protein